MFILCYINFCGNFPLYEEKTSIYDKIFLNIDTREG